VSSCIAVGPEVHCCTRGEEVDRRSDCYAAPGKTEISSGVVAPITHFSYRAGMIDPKTLTIAGFQKHIFDRYEKVDRERGTPKTFMFFAEEFGELATALAHGNDRANIEEEFADVFAWLCTLANINDVDLASAISAKYLGEKKPEGHK
jgi:NTP pyrophosphatase (non-canonical NTP hydrolase)